RADDREGRARPRGHPAIHLRARAASASYAQARRHVGNPGLAALDARDHRRRRAAAAGAIAGGRVGHRRRRARQALGGRPELHLQSSGVAPDPAALTAGPRPAGAGPPPPPEAAPKTAATGRGPRGMGSSRGPGRPRAPSRSPNSATPRIVAVSGSRSVVTPATEAGTCRSPTVYIA